jgi:hypothetical protein
MEDIPTARNNCMCYSFQLAHNAKLDKLIKKTIKHHVKVHWYISWNYNIYLIRVYNFTSCLQMFVQPNKLSIPTLMLPLPPEVEALITHQVVNDAR